MSLVHTFSIHSQRDCLLFTFVYTPSVHSIHVAVFCLDVSCAHPFCSHPFCSQPQRDRLLLTPSSVHTPSVHSLNVTASCSHPLLFTPLLFTTGRGRWHAPSSRHLRALLSVCGSCSFGGLECCSYRVCVCIGVGRVILSVCVCVTC